MAELKDLLRKYPTFDKAGDPEIHGEPEAVEEAKKPEPPESRSRSTTPSKSRRGQSQNGSKTEDAKL